jgi:hypothetical protein
LTCKRACDYIAAMKAKNLRGRPKKAYQTQTITIRLRDDQVQALDAASGIEGNRGLTIRKAVDFYLENSKRACLCD